MSPKKLFFSYHFTRGFLTKSCHILVEVFRKIDRGCLIKCVLKCGWVGCNDHRISEC